MVRGWLRSTVNADTSNGIVIQLTDISIQRIIENETRKQIYNHEVVEALRREGMKPTRADGQDFYGMVFKPYRLPEGLLIRGTVLYWDITRPQCSIVPSGNKGYEGTRL
jgi:hypothetical protein